MAYTVLVRFLLEKMAKIRPRARNRKRKGMKVSSHRCSLMTMRYLEQFFLDGWVSIYDVKSSQLCKFVVPLHTHALKRFFQQFFGFCKNWILLLKLDTSAEFPPGWMKRFSENHWKWTESMSGKSIQMSKNGTHKFSLHDGTHKSWRNF